MKPLRDVSQKMLSECMEALIEVIPLRSKWHPVENFIQLAAIKKLLQIIAFAYDSTFPGRAEMVRAALEVLAVCSVMPRVQLLLCEKVELQDDTKYMGINIILSAAQGEIVQVSSLKEIGRGFSAEGPGL